VGVKHIYNKIITIKRKIKKGGGCNSNTVQVALILDDRATGSLDKYVLGESNITLFLLSSYFCMG
jgi:hypothetical protein